MTAVTDMGEPMSRGRRDRWVMQRSALGGSLLPALLFTGVVLIGGILTILLIAWFQWMGWWAGSDYVNAEGAVLDVGGRLRPRLVVAD